jgi:hypothetical protein
MSGATDIDALAVVAIDPYFVDGDGVLRAPTLSGTAARGFTPVRGQYPAIHVRLCETNGAPDPPVALADLVPSLIQLITEEQLALALKMLRGQYLMGHWVDLSLAAKRAGVSVAHHVLRLGAVDYPSFGGVVKGYYAAVTVDPILFSLWGGWVSLDGGMRSVASEPPAGAPEYVEPLVLGQVTPLGELSAGGLLAAGMGWIQHNCTDIARTAREQLGRYETDMFTVLDSDDSASLDPAFLRSQARQTQSLGHAVSRAAILVLEEIPASEEEPISVEEAAVIKASWEAGLRELRAVLAEVSPDRA